MLINLCVFQKPIGGVAVLPGLGLKGKKKKDTENEDDEKENREQNEQVIFCDSVFVCGKSNKALFLCF